MTLDTVAFLLTLLYLAFGQLDPNDAREGDSDFPNIRHILQLGRIVVICTADIVSA